MIKYHNVVFYNYFYVQKMIFIKKNDKNELKNRKE